MNMIYIFLLYVTVLQPSTGLAIAAESNQSCRMSPQLEEDCGMYAHRIVKPMMAYFGQVSQKIERNDAEMENKIEKINEMEREVCQLRAENASFKDKIIKSLEDKDESNRVLIRSLQQQIDLSRLVNSNIDAERVEKLEMELKNLKEIIAAKDKAILQLETQVKEAAVKSREIETMRQQINQKNKAISEMNVNINLEAQKVKQCEAELKNQKDVLAAKEEEIQKKKTNSCVGIDSSGVQSITLTNDYTFDIMCNSDIAGPGWIIIQQRIRGGVEFDKDWITYRNGFGDFWSGDFFLGLDKIHRLTVEKPHELYIHMQRYDDSTFYARYNEFAISGEHDQYRISKLGNFSGNTTDELSYHKNVKFSTYDRDNDNSNYTNCAQAQHSGWWYTSCAESHLNGRYYTTEVSNYESNYWSYRDYKSLKQVKMMIRPKIL